MASQTQQTQKAGSGMTAPGPNVPTDLIVPVGLRPDIGTVGLHSKPMPVCPSMHTSTP